MKNTVEPPLRGHPLLSSSLGIIASTKQPPLSSSHGHLLGSEQKFPHCFQLYQAAIKCLVHFNSLALFEEYEPQDFTVLKVSVTMFLPWSKITEPKNSFPVPFSALGIHLQKFIIFPHRYLNTKAILQVRLIYDTKMFSIYQFHQELYIAGLWRRCPAPKIKNIYEMGSHEFSQK